MPVQIHNQAPVPRPLGRMEPDPAVGGAVELRLHGVGGTPPEELLGDLAPQLVAGDRIAGFYRSADQPRQLRDGTGRHRADEDRHVEGYSWGGLTSRSGSRALWVLMLPFALANVSGWMCRPYVLGSAPMFYLHRFVGRLAGLAMTLNLVVLLLMTGEDLIGAQCVSYGKCRGDFAPASLLYRFTDHHLGRSMAFGALLPAAMLVLLELLSRVTASRYENVGAPSSPHQHDAGTSARPRSGLSDKDFWHGYQAARRLSYLHLSAGLAVVAGVLMWTVHRSLESGDLARAEWVILIGSAALLAAITLSLALNTTGRWWTRTVTVVGVADLVAAAVVCWRIPVTAAPDLTTHAIALGMRDVANAMYGFAIGTVAASILVGLLAWLIRVTTGYPRSVPRTPGAKHFLIGPAVALAFAFSLVNAVGSLLIMRIGAWIGFPEVDHVDLTTDRNRYMYSYIASAGTWAFATVVALVVIVVVVVGVRSWAFRFGRYPEILADYPPVEFTDKDWIRGPRDPLTKDDRAWLAKIARARFLAHLPRRADWLLLLIAATAGATLLVVDYRYLVSKAPIQPASWLATVASFAATLAPLGLIALMRSSLKSGATRRHVGIAWDVATFWPRAYHPYAPPCYAERAVPDLQWRLWHLQAYGADVTIAAHSQGTVITAAALMQQASRLPKSTVRLITFGSPLDTLYRWAFPAYFSDEALTAIRDGGPARVSGWLNFFYRTDYIGNTEVAGSDSTTLPDPPRSTYMLGQPRPEVGSHSGYWTDGHVWTQVEGDPPVAAPDAEVPLPQPPPTYVPTQRVADDHPASPAPVAPPPMAPPPAAPPPAAPPPVAPPPAAG